MYIDDVINESDVSLFTTTHVALQLIFTSSSSDEAFAIGHSPYYGGSLTLVSPLFSIF